MNFRHRLFLLLLLLPAFAFGQHVPRGWQWATIHMLDGQTEAGQVRLREANLYQVKIKTRSPGPEVTTTKQRFDAMYIKSISLNDGSQWQSVLWSDHMGPRSIMMREVSPGLRYTVYKELQCRCNNSFKNRRAFIFPDGTVIRKKIWSDKPADPLPSGRNIKFSEIPTEVK